MKEEDSFEKFERKQSRYNFIFALIIILVLMGLLFSAIHQRDNLKQDLEMCETSEFTTENIDWENFEGKINLGERTYCYKKINGEYIVKCCGGKC